MSDLRRTLLGAAAALFWLAAFAADAVADRGGGDGGGRGGEGGRGEGSRGGGDDDHGGGDDDRDDDHGGRRSGSDDGEAAASGVRQGRLRPLSDILATVSGERDGTVVSVSLENGGRVYEVVQVTGDGRYFRYRVDARTSRLLSTRRR